MNKISVRQLQRRNIDEARRDKAGPYQENWLETTRDKYQKPAGDIESELQRAAVELEAYLQEQGRERPFYHVDESGLYGYRPSASNEQINDALDLLCEVAAIRGRIEAATLDGDTLGRVFRLGRNLETWRMTPFSKPAAGGIRQSVNAQVQQTKAYGTLKERIARDRALQNEVNKALDENSGLTKAAVLEEIGARHDITGEAVKKRLQRYKRTLGT